MGHVLTTLEHVVPDGGDLTGWRTACECGWTSEVHVKREAAEAEGERHIAAANATP